MENEGENSKEVKWIRRRRCKRVESPATAKKDGTLSYELGVNSISRFQKHFVVRYTDRIEGQELTKEAAKFQIYTVTNSVIDPIFHFSPNLASLFSSFSNSSKFHSSRGPLSLISLASRIIAGERWFVHPNARKTRSGVVVSKKVSPILSRDLQSLSPLIRPFISMISWEVGSMLLCSPNSFCTSFLGLSEILCSGLFGFQENGLIGINDKDTILEGLDEIERLIENGEFVWGVDREDVHMKLQVFIENLQ
nr:uncharacterized protein LOC107417088 [Ziziphus jujuba var. spinosa]